VTHQLLGKPLNIVMNERQSANANHKDERAFGGLEQGDRAQGSSWLHAQ